MLLLLKCFFHVRARPAVSPNYLGSTLLSSWYLTVLRASPWPTALALSAEGTNSCDRFRAVMYFMGQLTLGQYVILLTWRLVGEHSNYYSSMGKACCGPAVWSCELCSKNEGKCKHKGESMMLHFEGWTFSVILAVYQSILCYSYLMTMGMECRVLTLSWISELEKGFRNYTSSARFYSQGLRCNYIDIIRKLELASCYMLLAGLITGLSLSILLRQTMLNTNVLHRNLHLPCRNFL